MGDFEKSACDTQAKDDAYFMGLAIGLAQKGEGYVHPNPLVGAVIVKDGRVIGEGYHKKYGGPHAERNALDSLTEPANGATMYVTLEPCCHQGHTPPCTDAIIEHSISRVVIGSQDPNPEVSGKGAAILRGHGIQVDEGFMKDECDALNPIYFHYITKKTPYIIMKYAMTADGKIATKTGDAYWVSGDAARRRVHELRHRCMGIMVGIGAVTIDDPMLNCRIEGGLSPVRIICDSALNISPDCQICRTAKDYETIIVCAYRYMPTGPIYVEQLKDMTVINVPASDGSGVDLKKLMEILGERGIDSIMIEGGGKLNESALKAGIVNEVRAFVTPKIFGGGGKTPVEGDGVETPAQAYMLELTDTERIDGDIMLTYMVK